MKISGIALLVLGCGLCLSFSASGNSKDQVIKRFGKQSEVADPSFVGRGVEGRVHALIVLGPETPRGREKVLVERLKEVGGSTRRIRVLREPLTREIFEVFRGKWIKEVKAGDQFLFFLDAPGYENHSMGLPGPKVWVGGLLPTSEFLTPKDMDRLLSSSLDPNVEKVVVIRSSVSDHFVRTCRGANR